MQSKKLILSVTFFVLSMFIATAVITCSLFESNPDSSPYIPTDWKTTCTKSKWYVFQHYAQTDNSIPGFFTSFSNISFCNTNDNYTVIISKDDNNIGPFAFTFTSDNTGEFTIFQNTATAKILAVFSEENLTLTVPSGKKIILKAFL